MPHWELPKAAFRGHADFTFHIDSTEDVWSLRDREDPAMVQLRATVHRWEWSQTHLGDGV